MPPGSCASPLATSFPLLPQIYHRCGSLLRPVFVWNFGTFCIPWCPLLSSKYCWTGWANIIRPPAKPALGLFQWKLFSLRISESLPCQHAPSLHNAQRKSNMGLHHWWYRLYPTGLMVGKAAQASKSIWSNHIPCCLPEGLCRGKIPSGILCGYGVCPLSAKGCYHHREATPWSRCGGDMESVLLLHWLFSPLQCTAAPGMGWGRVTLIVFMIPWAEYCP